MEHPALPFRYERGRLVTVTQDSPEDVAQCVEAAARTRLGELVDAPDLGVPDHLMIGGGAKAIDLEELRAHLVHSEPRAEAIVDLIEDLRDVRSAHIRVLIEQGD